MLQIQELLKSLKPVTNGKNPRKQTPVTRATPNQGPVAPTGRKPGRNYPWS